MRLAFLFLFFGGNFVFAQELTFQQALEQMLQQNPSFSQKKINSQISQNNVQQAKSAYYPQLDFVESWSFSNNPVYVFGSLLNQQRFGAKILRSIR